jgi:hypothetical protein
MAWGPRLKLEERHEDFGAGSTLEERHEDFDGEL